MSTNPPPQNPAPDPSEQPAPAAPAPPPPPRRLLRSRSDRMLAGVAGGLGRHFGVDPVLVRIALVVLTFFGGAGVLLYLAVVLLVPEETDAAVAGAGAAPAAAPAERNRALTVVGVVLLVIIAGPLLFAPALVAGGILVPLAFLVLAALAVAWLATGERPGREPGSLIRATLVGLGILALCAALAVASFWTAGIGGDELVAGVVVAAGVAVVAGAFVRPVRWLVLPALAVALPAAFVSAAGISLDGGVGERIHRPGSAAELAQRYDVGTGRLVVDLRAADLPAGRHDLAVEIGMGEVVVVVPEDVCVATDAEVGVGGVDVFGRDGGGIDVDFVDRPAARAAAAYLVLDADVGVGHLDVRSTDPDDPERGFHEGRFGGGFGGAGPGRRGGACA